MAGLEGNGCIEVFKEYYLWSNKEVEKVCCKNSGSLGDSMGKTQARLQ